jgi:FlaA1/EpsC-like NDP-sugar epimerase
MRVVDLAKTLLPNSPHELVGIRPGEKLHEQMIGSEDSQYTYEYNSYYKILPAIHNWSLEPARIKDGVKVTEGFEYSSANNPKWMSVEDLQDWLSKNLNKIGKA